MRDDQSHKKTKTRTSGCPVAGGIGAAGEEDPLEVLLAGVVLLDVALGEEWHLADVAADVHLPGGVGHLVPVLPPLLVLLQVDRRHAPDVAHGAEHGRHLERRCCCRLGCRGPCVKLVGLAAAAGVHRRRRRRRSSGRGHLGPGSGWCSRSRW